MAAVCAVVATTMGASSCAAPRQTKNLSSRLTLGGGCAAADLRAPATTRVAVAHARACRRGGAGGAARRRLEVRAYEERDNDGPAIKVDLSMTDIKKGKKIGGGSFGDVFEGSYKGQAVVMKERKMNGPGKKFFDAEAALNRRLKNSAGVAAFLGVAGANAYLVWKDEGRTTLDTVLNGRGGGIAAAMGMMDEKKAVKAFSKQLLQAVNAVHKSGVIHRDVKPDNILFAKSGGLIGGKPKIKLIDLGGAADLRVGTNYSADETVFDPVYGPPEKFLSVKGVGSFLGLGAAVGWAQSKPDLFDAFSCGMVILQVSCPSLRKGKAMGGVKRDLNVYAFDAEAWRDSLPERRQKDFAILDADGGKGWDLVCGLLSQKKQRKSVSSAIGHPFLR